MERVRDVDVMPINPTENLPASFIESHSHILMNGHAMVEGQAVQHHRASLRDGPPARGPAAGRAQQEARAAAAAAQAQSQESDMHTLSEVPSHCQHAHMNILTGTACHSAVTQLGMANMSAAATAQLWFYISCRKQCTSSLFPQSSPCSTHFVLDMTRSHYLKMPSQA